MGGIGKTTLVREVARQAKEDKLFDKIISAYVSQTPDITKIQGEIAEKLGLECKEQSETLRAGRLYERLKKESKILIILDDIWGILELEAIGIPLGDENSRRKVLLTSRSQDVLSCEMDSQHNFFVDVLNEMETWCLFKKMASDCIENGELKSVATAVAKECAGLPIAVVTVARALRNKRLFEWKDVLLKLRRPSPRNFIEVQALAYSCIEFSYNHLESEELKNIFQLIGYAYLTSINDLFILGMGLGLFEGINKMEEAQIRVRTLVNKLKTCCMLLDDNIGIRDFYMHDVVRDVAISIASRDQHVFTARNAQGNQWYENKQSICTSLVLHDVKSSEFLEALECPPLKFFYVDSHNSSITIPDDFFMRMKELRVLNLSSMHLFSLPSSLCHLINLHTLRLYKCKLANIADIGDLKNLEILCLRGSNIKHLPVQVGQLTRLRLLDLSDCNNLEVVPPNVISCLSHLEELYMGNFAEWEVEGLKNERRNASLEELKHLSKLTSLEIRIKDVKTLPTDLFFKSLERYEILIANEWGWESDWNYMRRRSCRKFKLQLVNTDICLNNGHLMHLKGIEALCLFGLQNMKNVLYGLDRDGFPQLKHLHVRNNRNLLSVVESTDYAPHNAFPLLESLFLRNLIELEKICCVQLTVESFSKLKKINVAKCDQLKNIFSFSNAIGLQRLQSIEVSDCKNMEEIFAIEGEDESNNNGDVIELNQLRSLSLTYLPQLTSFCSKLKTPSMLQQKRLTSKSDIDVFNTFFNKKVVLPSLGTLALSEIKCEKIWHNQLVGASGCVQNLTRLIVRRCDKLKYIFSFSMVSNLVQLQHLEVSSCALLEEIVANERGEESAVRLVFPRVTFLSPWNLQLKSLELSSLNHLKHLWKEDLNLQNLTTLNVRHCDGLLSLVTPPIAKTLCLLQRMNICSCKMMTEIVANEGNVAEDEIVFNELKELKLSGLNSLTSFCSGNYIFNFPSLEVLYIRDCPKMQIFSNGILNAPSLQRVNLNWNECWKGDLNTTIQHFNKEKKTQVSGEPSTQHPE